MSNVEQYLGVFKPAVRAMSAYHLQERSFEIKLNQNESPFDLPPVLKEIIMSKFQSLDWNRYPNFSSSRLIKKLAAYLDVYPEQILVGNGSNELLQTLSNVSLEGGKRVLLVKPTFLIYEQLAKVGGADISNVEFNADWSFPSERIIQTVSNDKVDLCVLCSPNSPTGAELPPDDLHRILQATSGLVLLDEAYHEFSENDHSKLLSEHANLIVTRTFSKAMGLAGLRIGYLMAHSAIVEELRKGKLPYNLNVLSELTAQTLLDHHALIDRNVAFIKNEKNRVYENLVRLNMIQPFPSAGNFLMMKSKRAGEIFEELLRKGILVRDISGYHPRLKNMLRLSIGSPEENDRLLTGIGEIVERSAES